MSTPSRKPVNPIDLTAYATHKARERELTEQDPSKQDDRLPRSPYAPKRAHQPGGGPRQPAEAEHDPLRSPYAPKTARAPLSMRHASDIDGPRLCPDDGPGGGPVPATPFLGEPEPPDHSPTTAFDACAGEHPVDLDAPLQPADANSRRHQQPAGEPGDEVVSQLDLERLEASLRWLQRQEAATRLSRGAHPPPEPGLSLRDARVRPPGGERFVDLHRSPLSLEPQRLAPPPLRSRGDSLRGPLRILMASCVAAPFLYYFLAADSAPPSGPAPAPQMASFDSRVVVAPPARAIGPPELGPTSAKGDDPGASAEGEMPSWTTETSRTGRLSERETAAMVPPDATAAEAPPSNNSVRALAPEEIKLLIKQGEQFVAAGDLVTARIVLQRAAEAGDATAAVALGATYDPTVLAKLGVMGLGAEVEQARSWYRKAESLGSAEATRQLRVLSNR